MKLITDLFAPLIVASSAPQAAMRLLRELGWVVTLNEQQHTALTSTLGLTEDLEAVAALARDLATLDRNDQGEMIALAQQGAALGQSIFGKVQALQQVDAGQLASLPAPLDTPQVWGELALRLPNLLITSYLTNQMPLLYEILHSVGIISEEVREDPLPDLRRIHWDLLDDLMTDPVALIRQTYGWGGDFDHAGAMLNLTRLMYAIGYFPVEGPLRREMAEAWLPGATAPNLLEVEMPLISASQSDLGLDFSAGLLLGPAGPGGMPEGFALTNLTEGSIDRALPLSRDWDLLFEASGNLDRALEVMVLPGGISLATNPGTAAAALTLKGAPVTSDTDDTPKPWRLIGSETGPRLEVERFTVTLETEVDSSGPRFGVHATTLGPEGGGLKLVISPADGDGFIADVLGGNEMAITGGIGVLWSSVDGFSFEGGVGFETIIPLDLTLGPILIRQLRLGVEGGSQGLTLEAAVSGGLDVGVMAMVVEDIGLRASLTPQPEGDTSGLLGPLDLSLGFKPPTGLGLSIDAAGVVTGGGYLYHDEDLAEYGGVAEVSFVALKLSAIGILTTRMPDGSDGWSLFLSVFSEFPAIQLGFGITLNGVGGLVGLHRTFDDDALRERLQSGALDSIMFPDDPVANAPQIIEDIRAVFPPSQGQFVFGAMMQLGWGTPSLLTANLGVIVELPDPVKIALLGQIKMILPVPEAAIVEINMDVLGVANLTEGTLALDATLRDSHILHLLTLSGDMALRANFIGTPTMLMSVGGFHPKFTPPPETPKLGRMKASLPLGDMASVDLTAYVAVTSNSFQTGARVEIWVKAVGVTAEGWFGFDALIQFSPFGFAFDTGFGVTVKKGETTLMGVEVVATIVGPGPWEIDGTAQFKILGLKKKLNIALEVGERKNVPVPLYDVAAKLRDALEDPENWTVSDAAAGEVILRDRGAEATPRAHPAGRIEVRQSVVPLNLTLDKFGNGRVEGPDRFELTGTRLGSMTDVAQTLLEEHFAPAEFIAMKDAEKLKAPSFELFDAGVAIGSDALVFEGGVSHDIGYEEITIDPDLNQHQRGRRAPKRVVDPSALVTRSAALEVAPTAKLRRARYGSGSGSGGGGGGGGGGARSSTFAQAQRRAPKAAPVKATYV